MRHPGDDIERLLVAPRVVLGTWPTPLEQLEHPGIGAVLVKRDDLAGFGGAARSGVKARKLEGLLSHMVERRQRRLVMPLGNITNLGFDLVRAAQELDISVRLLIADEPPLPREQREVIFASIRENVVLLGRSYAGAAARLALAGTAGLWRRQVIAPPSPAHPAAIAGAARGYIEAMEQAEALTGALPSSVYVATAAGSTVAGFALGEVLMRAAGAPRVEVVAVPVVPQPVGWWVPALVAWTARYLKVAEPRPGIALSVAAEPRNAGYGRFDAGHVATCQAVEATHGFRIDPIYGGKSWSVMEERETARRDEKRRPPLFWHCGYTPNWQDYAPG
ncbi:MAG TPA: pyridoxal-phosphate dependent enzyme [Acetobacteraceae bacterium]|jgi:1-aminocyclopropane-1-carboxylate deaminase/D-cysteine desulfhydrase-like pyridoxal-dependent ACC family enzyme|nr:pyridoxal-phosphate dependent enzyme [Acetobacteraceae bacterium]